MGASGLPRQVNDIGKIDILNFDILSFGDSLAAAARTGLCLPGGHVCAGAARGVWKILQYGRLMQQQAAWSAS
jgi:hypothetical protein